MWNFIVVLVTTRSLSPTIDKSFQDLNLKSIISHQKNSDEAQQQTNQPSTTEDLLNTKPRRPNRKAIHTILVEDHKPHPNNATKQNTQKKTSISHNNDTAVNKKDPNSQKETENHNDRT